MFLVCFGTRPEYIKVKSIINNLQNVKTCFTGQHMDLLQNINVDFSLNIQNESENRLNNIMINILKNDYIFKGIKYVIVQGDTTTAMAIAISAFHHDIKVIHLEAGLRTYNPKDPYPEEMNRQIISRLTYIHLCPTENNKKNLQSERINKNIFITGNTGLDNIDKTNISYTNQVIITLHRRNNHKIINEWFASIEDLANQYVDIKFILPMHPNPIIQQYKYILKKVFVIEPQTHTDMIELIKTCKFIISDSGGLQEEASYLNKKIIICRENTERPEILDSGHGILCPKPELLKDIFAYVNNNYHIESYCPFGNGYSFSNIINVLSKLS